MTDCEHNHDFDVVDNDGETYCVECEFKRRLKGLKAELEEKLNRRIQVLSLLGSRRYSTAHIKFIIIQLEQLKEEMKQIWKKRGL